MSAPTETFQIPLEVAEHYEAAFVPRLFGPWAGLLVEAAGLIAGQRVLDVACGTGAVAQAAADLVGSDGEVTGVDLNANMLVVARRLHPDLEWRLGDAAALPFEADAFDAVLCQSALMFMPHQEAALREMARVARPRGRVALQVWDVLENQPGYLPLTDAVARHAGRDGAALMGTYWRCGDLAVLAAQCRDAGLEVSAIDTRTTTMRFATVEEFVATEVESTPLLERLGADAYAALREDAARAYARLQDADGGVAIPISGHLLVASAA